MKLSKEILQAAEAGCSEYWKDANQTPSQSKGGISEYIAGAVLKYLNETAPEFDPTGAALDAHLMDCYDGKKNDSPLTVRDIAMEAARWQHSQASAILAHREMREDLLRKEIKKLEDKLAAAYAEIEELEY